jgi:hypothetical protein
MADEVILTMASVPFSMTGSGTISTLTDRFPCQVSALIIAPLVASKLVSLLINTIIPRSRPDGKESHPRRARQCADGEGFETSDVLLAHAQIPVSIG